MITYFYGLVLFSAALAYKDRITEAVICFVGAAIIGSISAAVTKITEGRK